jgi:hypothetical protein
MWWWVVWGKTALVVRLTKLLAERGAVPVPIRLRDAQQTLDFRELGRQRFLADAEGTLLTDADRERVWWELCKNDRVVVLADGLEEALIEGEAEKDRDNHIRLAIRRAEEHSLPLVVASRPHDPVRGMDATIVELEPLSEEAALQYVRGTDPGPDEQRLDWIVETADVVETPLYLHITRELHRGRLMEWVSPSGTDGQLDTRSVDRAELRLRLLDAWTKALEEGYFKQGSRLAAASVRPRLCSWPPWPAWGCSKTASMSGSMSSRMHQCRTPAAPGSVPGMGPGRRRPVWALSHDRYTADGRPPTGGSPKQSSASCRPSGAAGTSAWPRPAGPSWDWSRRLETACGSPTASCRPIWGPGLSMLPWPILPIARAPWRTRVGNSSSPW